MSDRFIKLAEALYVLQGKRSSNIYYLDCEIKALIDTGHPHDTETNIRLLEQHGVKLDRIEYLINTHSHADHVGLNAHIKRGNALCQIVASSRQKHYQKLRDEKQILRKSDVTFEHYEVDIEVGEGDTLDLGQIRLKFIETPGHTIDSLSMLIEGNDGKTICFTGDTLYDRVVSQPDYLQDMLVSMKELEASYKRLKEIAPELVLPGHGPVINDPVKTLKQVLRKLGRFFEQYEFAIINTLVPSIEFYLYLMDDLAIEEIQAYLLENFQKLRYQKLFDGVDEVIFGKLVEKALSLMMFLGTIEIKDSIVSLKRGVNEYIGIKKMK